jgi:hypothetical protein
LGGVSEHDAEMLFRSCKDYRCIARSATTADTLRDLSLYDVSWPKTQVHFDFIALEVANILLLDDSNEYGADRVITNSQDVHLGKSIFYFSDATVDFFSVGRLAAQVLVVYLLLHARLVTCGCFWSFHCDFVEIVLVVPRLLW